MYIIIVAVLAFAIGVAAVLNASKINKYIYVILLLLMLSILTFLGFCLGNIGTFEPNSKLGTFYKKKISEIGKSIKENSDREEAIAMIDSLVENESYFFMPNEEKDMKGGFLKKASIVTLLCLALIVVFCFSFKKRDSLFHRISGVALFICWGGFISCWFFIMCSAWAISTNNQLYHEFLIEVRSGLSVGRELEKVQKGLFLVSIAPLEREDLSAKGKQKFLDVYYEQNNQTP